MDLPWRARVDLVDAIELMVHVLSEQGRPVLLVSTVDHNGFVGPGDCFSLAEGFPSAEVLFELARRTDTFGILCGSRATGSVLEPSAEDDRLYRHLLEGSADTGFPLIDHVLIGNRMFRFMRETDGLEPLLGL